MENGLPTMLTRLCSTITERKKENMCCVDNYKGQEKEEKTTSEQQNKVACVFHQPKKKHQECSVPGRPTALFLALSSSTCNSCASYSSAVCSM